MRRRCLRLLVLATLLLAAHPSTALATPSSTASEIGYSYDYVAEDVLAAHSRGVGRLPDRPVESRARGDSRAGEVRLRPTDGLSAPNSVLRSQGDPMLGLQGPGRGSAAFDGLVGDLRTSGFDVEIRPGTLAYSPAQGRPGKIILDPDASLSALGHEARHAMDDAANGFPGMAHYIQNPEARWTMEFNAYWGEITSARQAGRYDVARQLLDNARTERQGLLGF